ncbi:sensor histidine kinase [Kitasatospora sp. LaBMicrA B282]|uniref:sensor histidine kinase n=1 Tax=Kitasatospora sp. LaBMicrA B282 TaxID=3420949 RepID=UPI003D0FDFA1
MLTCGGLCCAAPMWLRGDLLGAPPAALFLLLVAVGWLLGNTVREHRAHTEALRARTTIEAITAERLEIARELHDLVAHSIGIIAIQAGVGSRVMDTQPEEARNALRAIEATSRETLAGLRRTVGSLRRPVDGTVGGRVGGADEVPAAPSPRGPAPGLAEVERLVTATAEAGVRVDVRWLGERRPLAPELELSAFRIVQEAVTNVVRHAGVQRCRVVLEYRESELTVEVTDRGSGSGHGHGGSGGGGGGFGLIGMRERVALLDGEFSAGPRDGGGFRVAARLPVAVAATAVEAV